MSKRNNILTGYHDDASVTLDDDGLVDIAEGGSHVLLDAKQTLALLRWLYEWADELYVLDEKEQGGQQ